MFKVLIFMKRRPGMSREAFRDYYETVHSKYGERGSAGIRRYVRRYLEPFPHFMTGEVREPPHDVVTELWFDRRPDVAAAVAAIADTTVFDEIVADEMRLFDRASITFTTVVEHDSAPETLDGGRFVPETPWP